MIQTHRMIPCLLLDDRAFYKTVRFADPTYLGDPLNILKIFNEKEVDEICILDIGASREGRGPDFDYLALMAEECFMPLSYGGGLTSVEDCRRIIACGYEKVVLNTVLHERPELAREIAEVFGSQAVVASIDVRTTPTGPRVFSRGGSVDTGRDPVAFARAIEAMGVGEILLNSVDRDGTMAGYDLALVRAVADAVGVPLIAVGGANGLDALVAGIVEGGASAVAAGSLFVFYGKMRAVLINPPSWDDFQSAVRRARAG